MKRLEREELNELLSHLKSNESKKKKGERKVKQKSNMSKEGERS
jgi:hypothetical protein